MIDEKDRQKFTFTLQLKGKPVKVVLHPLKKIDDESIVFDETIYAFRFSFRNPCLSNN